MLELALLATPPQEIHYTGIDLFESRSKADGPGLTLKDTHRMLKATGVRVRLVPGDPWTSLSRAANQLAGTDLLVIGADQDQESLAKAWFYVPRMLHRGSRVFVARSDADGEFREMALKDVTHLARDTSLRRAA